MNPLSRSNFFIITGAPGVGKTTLIESLRDSHTVEIEPARIVINEEKSINGDALWEKNTKKFVFRILEKSQELFLHHHTSEIVIFDRGVTDCLAYASYAGMDLLLFQEAAKSFRYNHKVFLLPPWEKIFANDEDRKMSFSESVKFHELIKKFYVDSGYDLIEVPKVDLKERRNFIKAQISSHV